MKKLLIITASIAILTIVYVVAIVGIVPIAINHTVDIVPVCNTLTEHAIKISRSIDALKLSKESCEAVRQAIRDCASTDKKDDARGIEKKIQLGRAFNALVDDGMIESSQAYCIYILVSPIVDYFDMVEKEHPHWDISKLKSSFFSNF